jgi:hypothetical protein
MKQENLKRSVLGDAGLRNALKDVVTAEVKRCGVPGGSSAQRMLHFD